MMLVTGAGGFVGGRIMKQYPDAAAAPSLRGADEERIRRIVEESGAEVIVHTAAISDVGSCEKDPEASYEANVLLPARLAKAAGGRKLICFSSDQVYSGCEEEGPYTEELCRPANTYARHKLEMENRVLDLNPEAVLLRAEWMYDMYPYRENYFMRILHAGSTVAFSSRQYRGITYLREVAENMTKAARLPGGVYNFGSETKRSMLEITDGFLKALGKDTIAVDCAPRHNLWMNCDKAKRAGMFFSSVEDGLVKCAEDYGLLR